MGKRAIQEKDSCYLVEGYMDVIAMHQAGIENVVASSGTSLTVDQIRSIHRFTRNITVLYDGDEAGQKASNRAIPLLLEEGMNVKLLQFPDNDDPDSYARKVSQQQFHDYIQNATTDFLYFKAKKLTSESKNDPIKRAGVIKDIVENIALIPDNIIRSIYIKECSNIMEIEESILQMEVNKLRRKISPRQKQETLSATTEAQAQLSAEEDPETQKEEAAVFKFDAEERELLKLLLTFGNLIVITDAEDDESNKHEIEITLSEFILMELWRDEISFENPIHQMVLDEYVHELSNHRLPTLPHFLNHPNPVISSFTINYAVSVHQLSPYWEKRFGIQVPKEAGEAKKNSEKILFSLKARILQSYKKQKDELLRSETEDGRNELLKEIQNLNKLISRVSKLLGRIVIR
jgi:DNA primase